MLRGRNGIGSDQQRHSSDTIHRCRPASLHRTITRTILARAKPWRPRLDDVDRLAVGDSAKVRGTGCRDIPHRLNAKEREVFSASKKKGFLAVRGTGYRKERRGNPLPNSFRQWCDAKELPCIVIEQAMLGGPLDRVVVDLATLRLLDSSAAASTVLDVARAAGVQQVQSDARPREDVPFNVLPLLMPGTPEAAAPRWSQPGTSVGTPANVRRITGGRSREQQGIAIAAQQVGAVDAQGDGHGAAESAPGPSRPRDLGSVEQLEACVATAEEELEHHRQALVALKAGPPARKNDDPGVAAAVARYKELQEHLAHAREALLDARAIAKTAATRCQSMRSASIWEAFGDAGSSSAEVPAMRGDARAGDGDDGPQCSEDCADSSDSDDARHVSGLDAFATDHPYYQAAIWQIPADPLFFECDRTTAKQLAKRILQSLMAG